MLQPNFRKVAFIFDRSISIAFKSGLYGGRYVPRGCNWGAPYFNSRPSARGDGKIKYIERVTHIFQFTHLREGRPCGCLLEHCRSNFNSRPSVRGDAVVGAVTCRAYTFQFPPLREGRQCRTRFIRRINHFNSRPSARGDEGVTHEPRSRMISIPAPPRGATRVLVLEGGIKATFQFTPLREGRRQKICNFCKSFVQPSQITAL